ncbi:MarR family transcriptional regulator [Catenulispora rubra]|uniref:MarR family transcriptional regulator n=1 Tax=Catenulispora rubra TaxID=280293 RepID=UPI001892451A|nr:helix-turn-helix domain-containing protein [Catenulispora rubra]
MPKNPSTAAPKKTKSTNKTPAKSTRAADPDAPAGLTPNQAAVLQHLSERAGVTTAEVAAAEGIGHSTAQKALTVLEAAGLARREAGVRNGALKSPDRWFPTTAATSADPESTREAPQAAADADASGTDAAVDDAAEPVEPDSRSGAAEPADLAAAAALTSSTDQRPDTPQDSTTGEPDETDDHAEESGVVPDAANQTAATNADQSSASVADPADDSDAAPGPAADGTDATGASLDTAGVTGTVTPAVEAPPTATSDARLSKGELRAMVEKYLRDHPDQAWTPSKIGKALGGRSAGAVKNAGEKLVDDGIARTFDDAPHRFQIIAAPAGKTTRVGSANP